MGKDSVKIMKRLGNEYPAIYLVVLLTFMAAGNRLLQCVDLLCPLYTELRDSVVRKVASLRMSLEPNQEPEIRSDRSSDCLLNRIIREPASPFLLFETVLIQEWELFSFRAEALQDAMYNRGADFDNSKLQVLLFLLPIILFAHWCYCLPR